MKLNIGETIKILRKEREITQEEFAEVLGVSCQSVSRWENNFCYPDIELIPTIAAFFGISTDKLMGIDEITEKENIEKYLEQFQLHNLGTKNSYVRNMQYHILFCLRLS